MFQLQVIHPRLLGTEQKIGKSINFNAIMFFRHIKISRSQSRFHVTNIDTKLLRSSGGSYRTVHITIDQNHIWLALFKNRAHRLHRLSPKARAVAYDPVFTYDADVVVTKDHSNREANLKSALTDKGFKEQFSGEASPPVTRYQIGTETKGFYAEFLTPLTGGTHRRDGTPDETAKVRGVNAQKLRYLELLLIEPWTLEIGSHNGFSLQSPATVRVPNPVSFIVQKMLVLHLRKPEKRAGDLLYIHDTLELFGAQLVDLAGLWRDSIKKALTDKAVREIRATSRAQFDTVTDTIRDAARIVPNRALDPVRMQQLCRVGLDRLLA